MWLNRAVAMMHAAFQRAGNRNMTFPAIVDYPFFARSGPSNGVQLAYLLAYSVYRDFKDEDLGYPYFGGRWETPTGGGRGRHSTV